MSDRTDYLEIRPEAALRPGADWWNRAAALFVGLFTFAIYRITLSPDVSFWDAGEFIAASHSLGIPHPPGTPLYVLMGRFFSILFHSVLGIASPAVAVNLLSAIPAAIAAVFLHLSIVRIGKKMWNGGNQAAFCLPALVAGMTAAIFAAFSNTVWIDAIEAEVYSVSGMWAVFSAWLILLWADSEPKDERLLVVIAYLLALNIGVHLATYLAALAILPFAFLHERRFAIPVSLMVVLVMAKDLQMFLFVAGLMLIPTLQFALLPKDYGRRYRLTLLFAHGTALAISIWAFLGLDPGPWRWGVIFGGPAVAFAIPWLFLANPKRFDNPFADLGFLLALVTVLGFSCHLYLPIRSALDPAINEAQPDNLKAFWEVILRSQYRPVPIDMRQATWVFQFDDMFWRYFREQWRPEFLVWALGIPGIIAHLRKERKTFVLFGLLFLGTTAALVVKMNFTDHEVRERNYFFAPGFFGFASWMGLGLGWLTRLMVEGAGGPLRVPAAALATILSLFISVWPVKGHWETHDRRGNWVANDYARNMLRALEPGAVLFTNGDNDTFPLWYLQEVEKFRTDVRVVNLSLLNTPWYAQQLRNERPHPDAEPVPMGYSNEQIEGLRPFRDQNGDVHLVKDQVAMDIVNQIYTSASERPVYFAVTVDDLLELDDYLKLEGLVFRLTPGDKNVPAGMDTSAVPGGGDVPGADPQIVDNVNLGLTRRNLEEVYTYRGLLGEDGQLDPEVYRDDNERKLVTNYAAAWARMALSYRAIGNYDEAIACLQRAIEIAPEFDPISGGLGSMLLEAGRVGEAREVYLERLKTHPDDIAVYMGLGYTAINADDWEEALEWYLRGIRVDPSSRDMLAGMYQAYVRLERYSEAENVLLRWLQVHPDDNSAKTALADVRSLMKGERPSGRAGGG